MNYYNLQPYTGQTIDDYPSVEEVAEVLEKGQYHMWLTKHRRVTCILFKDELGKLTFGQYTYDDGITQGTMRDYFEKYEEYVNPIRAARTARVQKRRAGEDSELTEHEREANRISAEKYRKNNPDKNREYQRNYHVKWSRQNPDKIKQYRNKGL